MDIRRQKINLVLWIGVFTTIAVIPSLLDPINLPKLFVITLGAGVLLGIFWNEICRQIKSGPRAITLIVGVFLCGLLLTSIFGSQIGFKVLIGTWGRNNGLLTYLALVAIFSVLASQRSSYVGMASIKFLSHLGSASALYGLIQSVGADPITWENSGNKVILTLGNSNFASAFLAISAIASIAYSTMIRNTLHKLFLLVSFLIQIYLILKSEAVQGLVIVFLGCALFVGLALSNSTNQFFRRISFLVWGATIISGATGILSIYNIGPFANFVSPYLFSLKDRYYHWIAAVNMMREYPVFGVGIDSFGEYFRRFRVQEAIDARGTAAFGTNNAHNVFLQIGSTGGLILLATYLALIFFIFYRAIIALRFSHQKNLVAGLFSIWIAFQVQTLVSIDQIGLVVWGWILGGALVSISYLRVEDNPTHAKSQKNINERTPVISKSKTSNLVVMLLVLIAPLILAPTLINDYSLRNKIVLLVSAQTQEELETRSLEVLKLAKKSKQPEERLQAINYLLQVGRNDEALELAKLNNLEHPNSFESWDATAQIYDGLKDKQSAIAARKKLILLDPLNAEIRKLLETDQAGN
jgi:O-antigen ligase